MRPLYRHEELVIHLFHGYHGQLGHMSLFMTSLLVIHECVAVQNFVLLSKGLIAIF
jgi:hypothetical protein